MFAALHPGPGTIPASNLLNPLPPPRSALPVPLVLPPMPVLVPRQFVILGKTKEGDTFRPSDWAERLAGAMSCFRPGGSAGGIGAHIGYSPYCVPHVVDGVKAVIVHEALRNIEPMAWDFVMNFARDNALVLTEHPPAKPK